MRGRVRLLRFGRRERSPRGRCLCCLRWREMHVTEVHAMLDLVAAVCVRCWDALTPTARVLYYSKLHDKWVADARDAEDFAAVARLEREWPKIKAAVLGGG